MGRSHAVSGAAGWLAACAVAAELGYRPGFGTVVLGAVVAAGCAVAPDADHPEATVARVFGYPSQLAAWCVARLCARVHAATRTRLDPPRRGGHRTLSHTAVAGLAVGWGAGEACAVAGRWAALVVVFAASGLAARSLFPARVRGDFGATCCAVAAAAVAAWGLPAGGSWVWLAAPVTFGWLAHLAGDCLTDRGCPVLWPVVVRGRRWYLVGTPHCVRFRAGDRWEQRLVLPAIAIAGLASAGWLLGSL